mmetsp:Transcript_116060/g.249360  ORF Transcript_116060/g.249360 Transcript_116060/m.249360 type:complete len:91 (-) Transcript_116060:795-1067(-)
MIAVSSNVDKVVAFGIHENNIFGFDSSINGRLSVWSVVGYLPLIIVNGVEIVHKIFEGAKQADRDLFDCIQPGSEKELSEGLLLGLIGNY